MSVLVTGAGGFIGFHVARRFLDSGYSVIGLDNLNTYYSPSLKRDRLAQIWDREGFYFHETDLVNESQLKRIFSQNSFSHVLHMAAQAGVRYSLSNPRAYTDSNLVGFTNILECCRYHSPLEHLVFASSSSVYGLNGNVPFSVHHCTDHPISIYAASKKANELMAHSYSHLYGIPCTGLRFFTVYGPWGRPDMAPFLFTDAIVRGETLQVYNYGRMSRDFTYIDDIVEGVYRAAFTKPSPAPDWSELDPDPATSPAQYRIYNIGNSQSVDLERFIDLLEQSLGKKARREYLPLQPGEVPSTWADVDDLIRDVGYDPQTSVEEGVPKFVEWYKKYYLMD